MYAIVKQAVRNDTDCSSEINGCHKTVIMKQAVHEELRPNGSKNSEDVHESSISIVLTNGNEGSTYSTDFADVIMILLHSFCLILGRGKSIISI